MEFLVSEIAGDYVTVKHVPGATPHSTSVDWSAQDIIDMLDSDLLFYIHGGADDYIPNNENVFDNGNVELIDMSTRLTYNLVCFQHSDEGETNPCDEGSLSQDPHFWLDPVLMADAALFVKDKLIATYPEKEALFNNNFTVLSSSLEKLNQDFQKVADEAQKPIITTVKLFSYWNKEYGIDIYSITNDPHSTESNPLDLINSLNFVIENDIHYIMFEKNANSPAGEKLLEDLTNLSIESTPLYLHGLGKLTEEEYATGATYLSIMYENLDALSLATK
jgi:zinc transport system substrate-binding protein